MDRILVVKSLSSFTTCLAVLVFGVEVVNNLGQLCDLFAHLVVQIRENLSRFLHRARRNHPVGHFRRSRR